jgi:hypothetical protein
MKKIAIATLVLAAFGANAADSFTVEGQHINNNGAAAQSQAVLGIKKDINSMFAGDLAFSNAQTEGTNALSTRLEAGVTGTIPLVSGINGYTRVALGQKYTNTTNFTYYSIEPGVTAAVPGVAGLTAKVGYRWRSADDAGAYNDQTHTMRYTLSYALTKVDSIGVRYDRVKGDNDQKIWAVAYTRGF